MKIELIKKAWISNKDIFDEPWFVDTNQIFQPRDTDIIWESEHVEQAIRNREYSL